METAPGKNKKVWVQIGIIIGVVIVLLGALIAGVTALSRGGKADAPVLVRSESGYEMYEFRNDTVRLTYRITLRNDSGADYENFTLRAVLNTDYKSGFLLDAAAEVEEYMTHNTAFTLRSGETQTWELVLIAPCYPGSESASGELPQLYAKFPDGTEGAITIK